MPTCCPRNVPSRVQEPRSVLPVQLQNGRVEIKASPPPGVRVGRREGAVWARSLARYDAFLAGIYKLRSRPCRCMCSALRAELEDTRANHESALERIEQLQREAARSTVCAHVPACACVRRHCSCARGFARHVHEHRPVHRRSFLLRPPLNTPDPCTTLTPMDRPLHAGAITASLHSVPMWHGPLLVLHPCRSRSSEQTCASLPLYAASALPR